MIEKILIDEQAAPEFKRSGDLSQKTALLLESQIKTWKLCGDNYRALKGVKEKIFDFEEFIIKVQFNPGRIISSSAKVDEKSIKERKCFLCPKNLPEDQRGLLWENDYLILCNPFPIFPEHFTIPMIEHIPQNIESNFLKMIRLTRDIGERYAVFYNGPKCGASAPDHMHFQAGNKNFMPIDSEYESVKEKLGSVIYNDDSIKIFGVDKYLRKFISFESSDEQILSAAFFKAIESLKKIFGGEEEPRINIICYFEAGVWKTILFPREKHRPDCYFKEGDENILLSPASVDVGGVCITPLEKDFLKITKEDIVGIFKEVSISGEYFEYLKKELMTV